MKDGLSDKEKTEWDAAVKRLEPTDNWDFSQVTGDFDENLENVTNPNLRGLESGGNGNGNGKGKPNVKHLTAYKYSTNIPLAEEIVLGGHPYFLQIIDGEPVIQEQIDLTTHRNEGRRVILKPHQIGFSPIVQYEYEDKKEIQEFIKIAQETHVDDLFFLAKSIWKDVVATKEKELIALLAADTIVSYFQESFAATHYLLLTGPPGWGKGAILVTFKLLGYRVVLAGDMSGANLLDILGSAEKCQVCIAEDEFDKIHKDENKQRIYKLGYEDMGNVPRTVDPSSSDRTIRWYNPYCLKFFAGEKAPDSKELGGFNDRLFRSEVKKGRPKFPIKEIKIQMEFPPDKQLPKYKTIISSINFLRKLMLVYRLLHNGKPIKEVNTNIYARALELCSPALRVFHSDELRISKDDNKALTEITDALGHFLRKKGQLDKKTIEAVIYNVLSDIFEEMDQGTSPDDSCKKDSHVDILNDDVLRTKYIITYDYICKRVMEEVEGNLISQRTFESADFGKVTHDSLLAKCRSVFNGENARIGRDKDNKKALTFDKALVTEAGNNFEVVSEIKIFNEDETVLPEDPDDVALWNKFAVGTNVLISRQYEVLREPEPKSTDIGISSDSTKNIQDLQDSSLHTQDNTETNKLGSDIAITHYNEQKLVHKSPVHHNNDVEDYISYRDPGTGTIFTAADFVFGHACWYCSLVATEDTSESVYSFDTKEAKEKHSIWKHTGWPIDPGDPDKEKYWNKIFQKREKSKVEEMAEANQSGDGVMFGSKEKSEK